MFSSEREKDLQTALNNCNESLRRSKQKNTRVQGINTKMTLELNEIHNNLKLEVNVHKNIGVGNDRFSFFITTFSCKVSTFLSH